MSKICTEEKSPLLFVVESNDDIAKAKKVQFENHRFNGITKGTTAVFAHFPNYIGTCWVTTAIFGLVFFMMMLLIISTITTAGLRVPRCVASEDLDNQTIHLVHSHVKDPNSWESSQVELVETIIKHYPKYKIHLMLIHHEEPKRKPKYERDILKETTGTRADATTGSIVPRMTEKVMLNKAGTSPKRRKRKIDDMRLNINMETKRLIDMLLHGKLDDFGPEKPKTRSVVQTTTTEKIVAPTEKPVSKVEDLLNIYPDIIVENTTFNQVFFSSPLYAYWPFMNEHLKIFAVRVLQVWQFGGISFDLQASPSDIDEFSKNETKYTNMDPDKVSENKLLSFVISEKNNYEGLPAGIVTVDDDGLHIESKVPCHAFFGQILMNLRRAGATTTIKDVLQAAIRVFCKHFAADRKYCSVLMKTQG